MNPLNVKMPRLSWMLSATGRERHLFALNETPSIGLNLSGANLEIDASLQGANLSELGHCK